MPVALLTPLWGGALAEQIDDDRSPPAGWRQWYTGVLAGIVFSVAMSVGWLAWMFAGDLATSEFLLAQYGAPFVDLFSGQQVSGQPWWLLLIVFNCMAVPWALWAPAWRSLAGVVQLVRDGGARLSVIWMASVVVPVVVVPGMGASGMNASALLLALPALSLVIAFLVFCRADVEPDSETGVRRGESVIGLVLVLVGAVVVVAPYSDVVFHTPWWLSHLAGGWGVLLIVLGVVIAYARPKLVDLRMMTVSVSAALVVVVGWLVIEPLHRDYLSISPAAGYVSEQLAGGSAIAFAGPYAGQFDFAARLGGDLPILDLADEIGTAAWIAGNPGAMVAQIVVDLPPQTQILEHFAYGTRYMVFWSGEALMANPALLGAVSP